MLIEVLGFYSNSETVNFLTHDFLSISQGVRVHRRWPGPSPDSVAVCTPPGLAREARALLLGPGWAWPAAVD
eukprot:3772806-Pyramimonas_sp.AAC.1